MGLGLEPDSQTQLFSWARVQPVSKYHWLCPWLWAGLKTSTTIPALIAFSFSLAFFVFTTVSVLCVFWAAVLVTPLHKSCLSPCVPNPPECFFYLRNREEEYVTLFSHLIEQESFLTGMWGLNEIKLDKSWSMWLTNSCPTKEERIKKDWDSHQLNFGSINTSSRSFIF